ncbi:MAG: hypothetical protein ABJR05_04205 [Balneola sp.]
MNSSHIKIVLATIFLGIASLIVFLKVSNDRTTENALDNINIQRTIETISQLLERKSEILIVAILDTEVCSPCITNLVEIESLTDSLPNFSKPVTLFIGENPKKVDRFRLVTDFQLPYKIVKPENLDPFLRGESQTLLFIDSRRNTVIHGIRIPTRHTSIAQKRFTLQEVEDKLGLDYGSN